MNNTAAEVRRGSPSSHPSHHTWSQGTPAVTSAARSNTTPAEVRDGRHGVWRQHCVYKVGVNTHCNGETLEVAASRRVSASRRLAWVWRWRESQTILSVLHYNQRKGPSKIQNTYTVHLEHFQDRQSSCRQVGVELSKDVLSGLNYSYFIIYTSQEQRLGVTSRIIPPLFRHSIYHPLVPYGLCCLAHSPPHITNTIYHPLKDKFLQWIITPSLSQHVIVCHPFGII